MKVDFLDYRFPEECRTKLFNLEEILNKRTNNKSYNFVYDKMTKEIEIFVRFPYDICISQRYKREGFYKIPVDILYNNIENNLYIELVNIFFKKKEE